METSLFRGLGRLNLPGSEAESVLERRNIANLSIALQIGFIAHIFSEIHPIMKICILEYGHIGESVVKWFRNNKIGCQQLIISCVAKNREIHDGDENLGHISSLTFTEAISTDICDANILVFCTGHHNIFQFSKELTLHPSPHSIVLSTVIGLPIEKLVSMFQVPKALCIRADPFLIQQLIDDSSSIPFTIFNMTRDIINWVSVKSLENSMTPLLMMLKEEFDKKMGNDEASVANSMAANFAASFGSKNERRRSNLGSVVVNRPLDHKEAISRRIRFIVFGPEDIEEERLQASWLRDFQKSLAFIVCVVQMP